MLKYFPSFTLLFILNLGHGQIQESPCSEEMTISRHLKVNMNARTELKETEMLLQEIIRNRRDNSELDSESEFVIPVVLHVFHFGEDGKMDMDQALSGLEILNEDFNGLNEGWNTIDEDFDKIKGTLDITFCLARKDPNGNPTTGVIYYENEDAMLNRGDLFQYAWDNYRFLNIYLPKYIRGGPSDFTAFAYYPSTSNSNVDRDGIFYSSIRWGYGTHSELEDGDDWASVCSHEAGHWLNLRHTFERGCSGSGDYVDDTPPTEGGTIEKEGCNNYDFSCGVHTNGENFMDYNHRCKKMFTQGQVERMRAALYLPSRVSLWSKENLLNTGCKEFLSSDRHGLFNEIFKIYPNPACDYINFDLVNTKAKLKVHLPNGILFKNYFLNEKENRVDLGIYENGIYFFSIETNDTISSGKFVVCNN